MSFIFNISAVEKEPKTIANSNPVAGINHIGMLEEFNPIFSGMTGKKIKIRLNVVAFTINDDKCDTRNRHSSCSKLSSVSDILILDLFGN